MVGPTGTTDPATREARNPEPPCVPPAGCRGSQGTEKEMPSCGRGFSPSGPLSFLRRPRLVSWTRVLLPPRGKANGVKSHPRQPRSWPTRTLGHGHRSCFALAAGTSWSPLAEPFLLRVASRRDLAQGPLSLCDGSGTRAAAVHPRGPSGSDKIFRDSLGQAAAPDRVTVACAPCTGSRP